MSWNRWDVADLGGDSTRAEQSIRECRPGRPFWGAQ